MSVHGSTPIKFSEADDSRPFYRKIVDHPTGIVLLVMVVLIAAAQMWHLAVAAMPATDESIHVEVGRMSWEGRMPYRDFSYGHPLLFPLLIGSGLKLVGHMWPLRMFYAALNCLMALPLYVIFRKMTGGDRIAAFLGAFFFLLYHEMMHNDARFFASRQIVNMFLIGFLYWGVVRENHRGSWFLQLLCAVGAVMTHLTAVVGLVAFSLAHIATQRSMPMLRRYIGMGCVVGAIFCLFLLMFPRAYERLILVHFGSIVSSPLYPRFLPFVGSRDAFFYVLSSISLLVAIVAWSKWRWWALCMVIIVASVLFPPEYFPHYYVIGAIPFAFGVTLFAVFLRWIESESLFAPTILGVMIIIQTVIVLPSLLQEWMGNRDVRYYELAEYVSKLPGPLLTFTEPIYSVDAHQKAVHFYLRADARTYAPLPSEEIQALADQACTILLSGRDQSYVPGALQSEWEKKYKEIEYPGPERIFITNNAQCLPASMTIR